MAENLLRRLTKKLFIVANLILAICFLLSCYIKWFNLTDFWFIGLLTLASLYFLIGLTLFFVFWILLKSRWALLFIITVGLTWNPIQHIIPFRLSSSFNIKKSDNDLRIMDWNVASFEIKEFPNHKAKQEEMLSLINKYQPDIACFQEMTCGDGDTSEHVIYHLNDFINTLNFPYHYYAYNTKDDYFAYTHYGRIIFSKYPIIAKKTVNETHNDYNYRFQYVDVIKNTDTIRIFNIHLQSLKFTSDNRNYIDSVKQESEIDVQKTKTIISKFKVGFAKRQIQADMIKAEIDKSPYPIIVCGDFNDVPNSYAYKTIGNNLQNSFVKKGYGLGRTFSEIAPTLRIDNIFVDKKFTVKQFVRVNKRLSDHYPIITDINLHKN